MKRSAKPVVRENTWNLLFVLANKTKLWKEWKMEFTKRGPMSDARIWSLMKLKGLLMRVDYYFLFNSVHLWTVPLSFTLFMVTTSTKRQGLLGHFKFIMRLKFCHIKGYHYKSQENRLRTVCSTQCCDWRLQVAAPLFGCYPIP